MTLRFVRIELARNPDNPDGDPNDAYEFTLPVGADSLLDQAQWHAAEEAWTFARYRAGRETRHGQIVERDEGGWAFSYEAGDADDETVFSFERHKFAVGEYITVTDTAGTEHVYRVALLGDPPGV